MSANRIILVVVAAGVLASLAAVMVVERNFVFDDSYITYRYARNLAMGHGITWNADEDPVEGYTNFLLVVGAAPVIRAGWDPLWATRIASVLALLGTGWLLAAQARRREGASPLAAALVGLAFLPAANGFPISMLGLETSAYTFFLFLAFLFAARILERGASLDLVGFGLSQFVAFLLRPEAPLLGLLLCAQVLLLVRREPFRGQLPRQIGILVATLGLPLALYLVWKWLHFGGLLPNTFYVKAGHGALLSQLGILSVTDYYRAATVLLLLCLFSLLLPQRDTRARWLAFAFVVLYSLFYLRVDTVMDHYRRFLYPLTPWLFFLALPAICAVFARLLAWRPRALLKVPVLVSVFVLMFFANPGGSAKVLWQSLQGVDRWSDDKHLMQREYKAAQDLLHYPQIAETSIAFGDAGVIPYFTGARHIDTNGLTDKFIGRTHSLEKRVEYLFDQEPTLIVFSSHENLTWEPTSIPGDQSLGGQIRLWAADDRWDDYAYVGSLETYGRQIHFHLRRDFDDFDALSDVIRHQVVDVVHEPFPLRLGSRASEAGRPDHG